MGNMINKPITLRIELSYKQALAIIKQLVEQVEAQKNKRREREKSKP